MDALISSGWNPQVSTPRTPHIAEPEDTYLDSLGEWQRPRELAESSLADRVALVVALAGDGRLARDGQDVVPHVDLDVLLGQAGEFERGRYEVLLLVLMQVQSASVSSASCSGRDQTSFKYSPWAQRARDSVPAVALLPRADCRRPRVERLIEEAVEVGEGIVRLGEERRKRHFES